MSHLPSLIADLAFILVCAGVMTLLFKRLRQPLVLGYIVAGFFASPHMPYMPSVADEADIKIWADIGVIFLLFSLGMDFSIKKMLKNGSTAVVAALLIMVFMILLGVGVGHAFGWKRMDCIYLGGMMAMSSTTIIYKAFQDMNLSREPFARLVIGVLVIEDILAVVMMVLLSTMAASKNFEGSQLAYSLFKLVIYLVVWFLVGIYLIPIFLKKTRRWLGNETLLIVSLALCFGMVVMASKAGFSAAFGAFVMGSILAQTVEVERIERLVEPLKDLFGAVFFVSVGMMVDLGLIVQYWRPILAISAAIILGQSILGSTSFVLAGQPLKTAMRCGFSLTQIGEFAFIIATMGMGLGVISSYIYPIVVAVSVLTTFLSPYMIRLSVPASNWVEKILPASWNRLIVGYTAGSNLSPMNDRRHWNALLRSFAASILLYATLCIAVIFLCFHFLDPLLYSLLPHWGASALSTLLLMAVLSPFLYALVLKQKHGDDVREFFRTNRYYRVMLLMLMLFRVLLAMTFVMVAVAHCYRLWTAIVITLLYAFGFVITIKRSRRIFKELERTFIENYNSRELYEEQQGKGRPRYAADLLGRDLHMGLYDVPSESSWGGKTLKELNLAQQYGIHVASLLRGNYRINIPGGNIPVFPGDRLQVIGTETQLHAFGDDLQQQLVRLDDSNLLEREMVMQSYVVDDHSPFAGKTIAGSGLRNLYGCLVVGVERDGIPRAVSAQDDLVPGDVLWLVAESKNLKKLKGH